MRRFLILFIVLSSVIATYGQSGGVVRGLILDPLDARIARAKVYVESRTTRQKLIANDEGSYSVDLPDGKYIIRAEMEGFYPAKKKKVRVVSGNVVTLNFTLFGIRVDSRHP